MTGSIFPGFDLTGTKFGHASLVRANLRYAKLNRANFEDACLIDADPRDIPEQTAALRRLLGVRVDEFWPIPPGEEVSVELSGGAGTVARDWSEWLEPDGGEPVASYTSGVLAGHPAVIRNEVGTGVTYYCSAGLDEAGLASIVARPARTRASARSQMCPPGSRRAAAPRKAARTSSC